MNIKPKRIRRDDYILTEVQRQSKENQDRFDELLYELDTSYLGLINRVWKRHYHFQLVYSRIFRKWRKDPNKKKFVSWFKRQPLYPNEVVLIVNVMWVLEKKYGYNWKKGNILSDAMFIAFMIDEDLVEKTMKVYRTKGFVSSKTPISKKQALREFIARGFVEVNDFEDYDPDYPYVVVNFKRDTYYYPQRCYGDYEQMREGLMNVHILQNLVGIRGHTAVKYSINKNDKNESRRKTKSPTSNRARR